MGFHQSMSSDGASSTVTALPFPLSTLEVATAADEDDEGSSSAAEFELGPPPRRPSPTTFSDVPSPRWWWWWSSSSPGRRSACADDVESAKDHGVADLGVDDGRSRRSNAVDSWVGASRSEGTLGLGLCEDDDGPALVSWKENPTADELPADGPTEGA